MKALLALALLLGSPASAEEQALTAGGRQRWVLLREPAQGQGPRPLILLLHGGAGNPAQAERAYRLTGPALDAGFLVAYPAGTGYFTRKRILTWNAGNCCGHAREKGVDDVGFLAALIERLVKDGRADPKAVFVTGMSNGAMMAHRLACERADLVAAIAPVAGTLAVPDCKPSRPVSVLVVHGTEDEHVPFAGGVGAKARDSRTDRSVRESANIWAGADRCDPGLGPVGANGDFSWSGCADGSVVRVVGHPGGHIWPGSAPGRYPGADPMLDEPKTTALILDFFKKHPRP